MPSGLRNTTLHPHVRALLREMQEADPMVAVRAKAAGVVRDFVAMFGGEPPFNLQALASFRGLHSSTDAPAHSADSEIVPQADGKVVLRVNRDRPATRQRFSVGHELGHTLFQDFHLKVQCRKAFDRAWADSDDQIEMLCDVAASEFLFPAPWFSDRVGALSLSSLAISTLAADYQASREATLRRLLELRMEPLAVVFFSWKLKPTEARQVQRDRRQQRMFGGSPEPEPKLRVDYGITNDAFDAEYTDHIPKDKSVPSEGPFFEASMTQSLRDGTLDLDLGSIAGSFAVCALPNYTPDGTAGPNGGVSVAALLVPQ